MGSRIAASRQRGTQVRCGPWRRGVEVGLRRLWATRGITSEDQVQEEWQRFIELNAAYYRRQVA